MPRGKKIERGIYVTELARGGISFYVRDNARNSMISCQTLDEARALREDIEANRRLIKRGLVSPSVTPAPDGVTNRIRLHYACEAYMIREGSGLEDTVSTEFAIKTLKKWAEIKWPQSANPFVDEITRQQIQIGFVDFLAQPYESEPYVPWNSKTGKEVTRTVRRYKGGINKMIRVLRPMFAFFQELGWTAENPFRVMSKARKSSKLAQTQRKPGIQPRALVLTEDEMDRLVDYLGSRDEQIEGRALSIRNAVIVLMASGRRYSALWEIEARHIRPERRMIQLRVGKERGEERFTWVRITPHVMDIVVDHMTRLHGPHWRDECDARMFPIKIDLINPLKKAVKAIKLDKVTPHTLRHNWTSWALALGCPEHIIKETVGWGDARSMTPYKHSFEDWPTEWPQWICDPRDSSADFGAPPVQPSTSDNERSARVISIADTVSDNHHRQDTDAEAARS